jgi:hypothetical protein
VDWIDHQATTAKPFDRAGVQTLAFELSGTIPGKNWHRRFEQRHLELSSSKPSNLDPKRAQNFNSTNVAGYFDLLKSVYDSFPTLPPEHIWNMDEKGLQLGGGRKRTKKYYHLKTLKKSKFYRVRSDNLELVTVIECISPSGLSIPPSFVLSSGPTPALLELDVPIGAVATSPNGWTDNELGTEWFKQTFVPFATSHKKNDDPILLLLDGHDSHETDGLREVAYEHNIIIIAFPSKCTHKLQPLDVTVFGQTQRAWANHCDRRIYDGVTMNRYNIIPEYMKVRTASMTQKLFRSAFSCTGIYPFNSSIFTDVDFAPAMLSSILMHTPSRFPTDARSSSPVLPSDMSDCDASPDEDQHMSESEDLDLSEEPEVPAEASVEMIDWDTDPDDFDYEPPLDDTHSPSPPPSSVCPSCASCPPLAHAARFVHVGPAVPATPPFYAPAHASNNSGGFPAASSMPSAPPSLVRQLRLNNNMASNSEPSDEISIDPENLSRPASRYFTRSQKASSPALSVSVALDRSRAPIPSSVEEKDSEINRLRLTLDLMAEELTKSKAETELMRAVADASNAHCTIMTRAMSDSKAEIEQLKRKTRQSIKSGARYVSHPDIQAKWATEQEEKAQRGREAAEKEALKKAEEAAHNAQIQIDIQTKVFTGVSYSLTHMNPLYNN